MKVGLLGPLELIADDGTPLDLGGRQPRLVLAVMLAANGRLVTADALAQELWGDDRPATASGTVQSYVSRLRRMFESSGAPGARPQLVWEEPGYRLDPGPAEVDFRRFEALADEGRALFDGGRLEEARQKLVEADALWRGTALVEFLDHDFATGLATRLEERRLSAVELRVEADLRLGRHDQTAGELAELVGEHPLREGLRAHLALALYRSGRQADALRAIDDARRTLRDELGVDPGHRLRELEAAILAHDRALDLDLPAPATGAAGSTGAAQPPVDPGPAPRTLVGRQSELAEVLAALEESAHAARVVVIEGEPGIGKTRLAEELRAEAERRRAFVVWGRGYEGGAAPALWPWLAPLRELAESYGTDDASLEDMFTSEAPVPTATASAVRFERFEAVARFLERVASKDRVVVVLDDVQWADEASLELLTFLSTRLGRGVLVVLTMRRLEVGRNDALTEALAAAARRPGSRRVQLRGLTEAATAEMLGVLTEEALAPEVATAIHERSEGNPFYATELAHLVLEDDPSDARAMARTDVPAGVGDVIRRRLAHLPEATRELLSMAAVVGRDIELGLLTRIAGDTTDAALDCLEPAVVHRLLLDVPDRPSTFRFCHALVREVLVEDLSSLRRARLHLRVADAIEASGIGDDDVEVWAEHLWRAVAVGGGQRAATALERAADVAIRRVALGSAEELLRRAVELRRATGTTPADEEAELLAIHRLLAVARARRYFASATTPQLLERAKELAKRTGRNDVLADVLWVEWSAASTASRIDEAASLSEAFIEVLLASDDVDLHAFAEDARGIHSWQTGRIGEATASFDRAAELRARAAAAGNPSFDFAGERQILGRLFGLLMHTLAGDITDAGAKLEALLDGQQDRFVITEVAGFTTVLAEVTGDWGLAERVGLRVRAVDRDADFSFYSAMALMGLAIAFAHRGELDEARPLFEHNRARYLGVGGGSGLACHDASWALGLVAAGAVEEAADAAATARDTLDRLHELWTEPLVLLAQGAVAHARADAATAEARFAAAVDLATEQGAHGVARRAAAYAQAAGVPLPA